jgi:predicted AAA+ superfamily ATPase
VLLGKGLMALLRTSMEDLIQWKTDPERKPMILRGARRVGKTWLMKEFGRLHYSNVMYFNFEEIPELHALFEASKNPQRIVEQLASIVAQPIRPGKTLIIFDEIQSCPATLNSLKYFRESANEYHILAACSLWGLSLGTPISYPVGQVDLLTIRPMTFEEFLATVDERIYAYYQDWDGKEKPLEIFESELRELYGRYLIIGGMPECVASWVKYKDPKRIERAQDALLQVYENDIMKYGERAREFELAVEWLVSAGLVNRVYNVSKPEHPLKAFDKLEAFKLFFFDTGLLSHLAGISNKSILLNEAYQFKGPLTENFVLQQLVGQFLIEPRYYAEKNKEIDFLVQYESDIIPIEVKGGSDKSAPSFKRFIEGEKPRLAIRFSLRGFEKTENFVNVPLYWAGKLKTIIKNQLGE